MLNAKSPRGRADRQANDPRIDSPTRSGGDGVHRGGQWRWKLVVWGLTFCAVIVGVMVADYRANAGKIYRGVEVGNVSLGGKTPGEALGTLEERAAAEFEKIRFDNPGSLAVDGEELGLEYDLAATVEEAYSVGRRGSAVERLAARLESAFGTVGITPEVSYDPESARLAVEELAGRAEEKPRDASVATSGSKVEVEKARAGFRLDGPATVDNLEESLQRLSGEVAVAGTEVEPRIPTRAAERAANEARTATSGPVVLSSGGLEWSFSPDELAGALKFVPGDEEVRVRLKKGALKNSLAVMYRALTVEPIDARFSVIRDEVVISKSRTGWVVEDDRLFDELRAGIFEGRKEFEVPVASVEPELSTAEAERLKPTTLLGEYRTDYTVSGDDSRERVKNLRIASKAINGTAIAPGEVFSANEILSPLDYYETKVFVDGAVAYADGGGLCQVTSTLYMATNYAGLDVVERNPHYAELPYIRPGFDATVWFGSLDYKFQNDTDDYVLVREYVRPDGYIYAEIWGRPTGKKVTMESEQVASGANSSSWVTYKTVRQNEEVLFDGVLHRDTYQGIVGTNGKTIPPSAVPTAPVDP